MGAVKKDVLLILYTIGIARVTSRGGFVISNVQVIRRVWAGSLKRDTLRITSRGRSRSMYLGRVYGECVTRALLVGRAHHLW